MTRVHLYVETAATPKERILCGDLSAGYVETKVTEFGPEVTCPDCRALMGKATS